MMNKNSIRAGACLALILSLFSIAVIASAAPPATELPYGNVVFLWGRLDKDLSEQMKWVNKEKERFEPIDRWLRRNGFGVRYEMIGTREELSKTAQDPQTVVIIWSGMAAEEEMKTAEGEWQTDKKWTKGDLIDANGNPVPYGVFDNTPNLRQIVLGSCHGELSLSRYAHNGARMLHFSGVITMTDLFDFLENGWGDYLEKDFAMELRPEKPLSK